MSIKHKNVTDKAVRLVGSISEVSRRFKFKSSQSVANWITKKIESHLNVLFSFASGATGL